MPTLEHFCDSGVQLGLISNLASPYKRAYFDLGLSPFFDVAIFSCDVSMAKPNPEIYRLALDRLGVDPGDTIMVGDKRRADVDGPGACGIRGYLIDRDGDDSGSSHISELTELMEMINRRGGS
ncbi:MAG: HAD family hydrolase [Pirellulales bacterium]|nr:HAD family hydrolase [Pirellulales bacterium]